MTNTEWVIMYRDQLEHEGLLEEREDDNLTYVEIPTVLLRRWYEWKLKEFYPEGFEHWLYEESIADDMDDFFFWTSWRPDEDQMEDWM